MSERPAAQNERRCVVLLAEDYAVLARIRARHLEGLGLVVHTARDGDAALRCLAATRIDVLVADYRLPGLDGIALLAEARRRQPELGRILISGDLSDEAREWADREGVPIVLKGEDPPDVLPRVILRECRHHAQ